MTIAARITAFGQLLHCPASPSPTPSSSSSSSHFPCSPPSPLALGHCRPPAAAPPYRRLATSTKPFPSSPSLPLPYLATPSLMTSLEVNRSSSATSPATGQSSVSGHLATLTSRPSPTLPSPCCAAAVTLAFPSTVVVVAIAPVFWLPSLAPF